MRILIASQDWDYRFARPQHFARIFSEQHQVTYLATGPGFKGRLRDVIQGNARWRPLSYRIAPRLQAFSAAYVVERDDPDGIRRNCRMNASLSRYLHPQAFRDADVGVTTNPLHYDTIINLPWKRLVYDCLDRYEGFFPEGHPLRSFVIEREQRLLHEADFVFASARLLVEDKSRDRKVHYLPHGVEVEYFQTHAGARPSELRALQGPIVGFVGGVEHWVNLDWVAAAADQMREVNFVLVGDIRIPLSDLPRGPNIRFLGYQPYSQIPSYIAAFDACIIPFHINHLTAAVNPIKALEYFALGKPVVTSYMPELEYYEPRIVQVRETDQFVQALRLVLAHDTVADRQARQEIARSRSWRRIAASFLRVVTGEAEETGF